MLREMCDVSVWVAGVGGGSEPRAAQSGGTGCASPAAGRTADRRVPETQAGSADTIVQESRVLQPQLVRVVCRLHGCDLTPSHIPCAVSNILGFLHLQEAPTLPRSPGRPGCTAPDSCVSMRTLRTWTVICDTLTPHSGAQVITLTSGFPADHTKSRLGLWAPQQELGTAS